MAALAGLLLIASCKDSGTAPDPNHQAPPDSTCGHVDNAAGMTMVSHGDTLVSLFGFTFDPRFQNKLEVPLNGVIHGIQVTFLDPDRQPILIANDCQINSLGWVITNTSIAEGTQEPDVRWYFNLEPKSIGTTNMRIRLVHDTHYHYQSEPIPVIVDAPTP